MVSVQSMTGTTSVPTGLDACLPLSSVMDELSVQTVATRIIAAWRRVPSVIEVSVGRPRPVLAVDRVRQDYVSTRGTTAPASVNAPPHRRPH